MSIAGVEGSHAVNSLEDPPGVVRLSDALPALPVAVSVCDGAPSVEDSEIEFSVVAEVVEPGCGGEGELDGEGEDPVSEVVGCPPEVEVDVDGWEAEVLPACPLVELDVPPFD